MSDWLDATLYPETEPPEHLTSLADRIDFLVRLCAAWDFGILPRLETIAEVRRSEWRDAVEACQLLTSHTYHLLRRWHGLPPAPYLGQKLGYILNDPNLAYV